MRYVKLTAGILSVEMLCHPNKKPYKYFHQSNQDYIDYHTNKTEDLTKTDASKSTLYFILVNNKEKSLTVS